MPEKIDALFVWPQLRLPLHPEISGDPLEVFVYSGRSRPSVHSAEYLVKVLNIGCT